MKWYNDMTEQEKRSFQKVIVVCTVGVDFNSHCSYGFSCYFLSKS